MGSTLGSFLGSLGSELPCPIPGARRTPNISFADKWTSANPISEGEGLHSNPISNGFMHAVCPEEPRESQFKHHFHRLLMQCGSKTRLSEEERKARCVLLPSSWLRLPGPEHVAEGPGMYVAWTSSGTCWLEESGAILGAAQ